MTADPKALALAEALKASADNTGCDQSLIVVGSEELEALLSHIYQKSIDSKEACVSPGMSATNETYEEAISFIDKIARFSIWEYDMNDGTPYQECDEPPDGFLDSHCALMGCIEKARGFIRALPQNGPAGQIYPSPEEGEGA